MLKGTMCGGLIVIVVGVKFKTARKGKARKGIIASNALEVTDVRYIIISDLFFIFFFKFSLGLRGAQNSGEEDS